jgi:hypothetical protein
LIIKTVLSLLFFYLSGCTILPTISEDSRLQGIAVELTTHPGYQQQFDEEDEI